VRPFSNEADEAEDEEKRIEQLAASIEAEGQLDAVLITPEHVLCAGHRRRRAILLINERRTTIGASLLKVRCSIDRSGHDMRRKAIMSNLMRREMTVMDMAYLSAQIRRDNGWQGYQGTLKVASYMGVNQATISQAEKLLEAERELQKAVHAGALSKQSALAVMKAEPTSAGRQEVLARAREIQLEDRTDRILREHNQGKMGGLKARRKIRQAVDNAQDGPLRSPAVFQAIRERNGASRAVSGPRLPLSRADLLDALIQFDNPVYPLAFRLFCRYFVDRFAPGAGSSEELRERVLALNGMTSAAIKPHTQGAMAN
jgi:ParB-like nuclease domain